MHAALKIIYPDLQIGDLQLVELRDLGQGVFIDKWNDPRPQPTPSQIAAAQITADDNAAAEAADLATYQTERADLKSQLQTAANRLTQIKDAASMTNAQVFAAVKDMAQIQLRMLKYIRRL